MPLDTAAGIAKGASAFVQNFLQARQQKHQMDLQKNMPLVEILQNRIADPNTNYYERAKIMDQIPNLLGIKKMDRPLSHILGYDKLNEKDFEVEAGTKGTPAQAGQVLNSDQTNSPNQGQTLQLKSQQATNDIPALTKKYGDTTPAEVHLRLQQQLENAKDKGDIKKQLAIAEGTFNLQKDILGRGGFTELVSRGFVNGEFQAIYKNPDGETKTIRLPGFSPEIIEKAKITGAMDHSKFGQLAHAHFIIQSYESDPTSVLLSDYNAAKETIDRFNKTGTLIDSTIEANKQKVTGTQPIQPGAAADNSRADENIRIAKQTSYDNAVAQSLQTSREAADFATQANAHVNNVINPLKERIAAYLKEQGYVAGAQGSQEILTSLESDSDYKALQNQLRNETSNYEALKSKADSANARDKEAKQKVIDAKTRLGNSSSGESSSTKYSATQKAMIENVRKSNPNANLSDDQIAEQILASPYKSKFK